MGPAGSRPPTGSPAEARADIVDVVEPVGLSTWLRRAESRLGEPIEAACTVVPKSLSVERRLAEAALTGESTPLLCLVVTANELFVFNTRRGCTLRPYPGDELLRVSLTDIARVVRVDSGLSIGFRIILKDGRDISLGAVRMTRGDAVLARLVELVGLARRPAHDAIVRASGHSGL